MESNKNKAWLQGLGSTGTFSGPHRSQQAETDRQNKKRQLAIARSFKQNPLVFTFGYPIIGGFAGIIVLWIVGGFKSKMKPG